MDITNGHQKQMVKAAVVIGLIVILGTVIVTRDWSALFRESAVSSEVQRSNVQRLDKIEQNLDRMRGEFATKESQEALKDQVERLNDNQERMMDLLVRLNMDHAKGVK